MRNFFTITILVLSMHILGQIPTKGLVAYYPFNGNANDESGNGNNGIVYGATLTTDRFGNSNYAYSFSNNYIEAVISKIPLNSSRRCITGWFKTEVPNFTDSESCIMNYGNLKTLERFSLNIYPKGYLEPISGPDFSNNYDFYINNHNYLDNNWYFFSLMYDGTKISLSVNGGQAVEKALSINTINNIFRIGQRISGDSKKDSFNGTIDDIRIYNRVLTQQEISALYNENITSEVSTPNSKFKIKVYPNPAKDHVVIDYGNYVNLNGYTLKITNTLGASVFTTAITQQTSYIDLKSWSGNGIYFVHLIDLKNNTFETQKIIIQ